MAGEKREGRTPTRGEGKSAGSTIQYSTGCTVQEAGRGKDCAIVTTDPNGLWLPLELDQARAEWKFRNSRNAQHTFLSNGPIRTEPLDVGSRE